MKIKEIQKYLLLASFIGTFAEQMITPLYGIFVTKIGGSIIDAGIGAAIFSIFTGCIVVLTGRIKWFNDNTSLIVMLGFLLSGFGDFAFFFVHNTIGLFLVQALIGISVGMLNPAWEALYTQSGDEGEEHKLWSLWGGGAYISTGISAIIGSVIASIFGFKTMFIFTAIINIVAVYYSYLLWRQYKR